MWREAAKKTKVYTEMYPLGTQNAVHLAQYNSSIGEHWNYNALYHNLSITEITVDNNNEWIEEMTVIQSAKSLSPCIHTKHHHGDFIFSHQ